MGLGARGRVFSGLDRCCSVSWGTPASLFLAADCLATLKAISLAGVLGYSTDCALGMAGVLEFQEGAPGGLWLVFATTLASSLSWLSR